MSVKTGVPGKGTQELKESVERLEQKQGTAAALFSMSFQAQIKADRATGTAAITDEMILLSSEIVDYPEWEAGKAYTKGDVLRSNGLFFEVVAAHISDAAYPVETTFAYYRHIDRAHAGTQDDPIPYPEAAGILVAVEKGKHYGYKGAVYLAKADMPDCVYPPDTPGMWQWEKVK